MTEPKLFAIELGLAQRLLDYLKRRPFEDVYELINDLINIDPIVQVTENTNAEAKRQDGPEGVWH